MIIKDITEGKIKKTGVNFRLHNYFPNLAQDFVLNLASASPEIRKKSRTLIHDALRWSAELESNYYAFHAGFLLNIIPAELGGNLQATNLLSREDALQIFREELFGIKCFADTLNVDISVENNVYDFNNYKKFGSKIPFLGVCENDISEILVDGVGLLLDFGHLKVSANVLGLDPLEIFDNWSQYITGYHLSDNNGFVDQNKSFDLDSWFMRKITDFKLPITLEVFDLSFDELRLLVTRLEEID